MFEFEDINFYLRKNFKTVNDLEYYGSRVFKIVDGIGDGFELKPLSLDFEDNECENIYISGDEFKENFYSFIEFLASAENKNIQNEENSKSKIKYMDERYCVFYNNESKKYSLEINPSLQTKVFEKALKRSKSTR